MKGLFSNFIFAQGKTLCFIAACLAVGSALAEPIYRSVDEQGNVTFSNNPPGNAVSVEEVEVQPGPSEAARREGIERAQRLESTASEMGEKRLEREEQRQQKSPETTTYPQRSEDNGGDYDNRDYGYRYRKRPLERPVARPKPRPLPSRR